MRGRDVFPRVIHVKLVAARLQIGRHAGAHGAETDEPDLHAFFSSKTCVTIFAADIALAGPRRTPVA
jgi:hypothetical protein